MPLYTLYIHYLSLPSDLTSTKQDSRVDSSQCLTVCTLKVGEILGKLKKTHGPSHANRFGSMSNICGIESAVNYEMMCTSVCYKPISSQNQIQLTRIGLRNHEAHSGVTTDQPRLGRTTECIKLLSQYVRTFTLNSQTYSVDVWKYMIQTVNHGRVTRVTVVEGYSTLSVSSECWRRYSKEVPGTWYLLHTRTAYANGSPIPCSSLTKTLRV